MRFASRANGPNKGVTGITIVNPQGESYDIDGFGMIVRTKEGGSNAHRPKGEKRPRRWTLGAAEGHEDRASQISRTSGL
jgi:hypothetical protein